MALLSSFGQKNGTLSALASTIKQAQVERGSEFANAKDTDLITSSLESLGGDQLEAAEASISDKRTLFCQMALEAGFSVLDRDAVHVSNEGFGGAKTAEEIKKTGNYLTSAQVDAAVITMMASGDPIAYERNVMKFNSSNESLGGINSDFRQTPEYGIEAYDAGTLSEHMPYSIVFNMAMAKQSAFSELLFKPVIGSPDQNGMQVKLTYPVVQSSVFHPTNGTVIDLQRRRLIESLIDPTVLDKTAEIIPFYDPASDESKSKFVDAAVVTPRDVSENGVTFKTSYLKAGEEINLIGLGQNPGNLTDGVRNHTDALDRRLGLEVILLRVTNDAGVVSLVELPVNQLEKAYFQKSPEGKARDMVLGFHTSGIAMSAKTLDLAGNPAAALQGLAAGAFEGFTLRLRSKISGSADLETGTISVAGTVDIARAVKKDGTRNVSVEDKATLDALRTEIASIEFLGYDPDARLSNSNRRREGTIVDTELHEHKYNIMTGDPVTARKPQTAVPSTADFAAPLAAVRQRNDLKAVTTLLNADKQLAGLSLDTAPLSEIPAIDAVGKYLIFPYYNKIDVNLADAVNSISSSQRANDISATIIDIIRDQAYKALETTGYVTALEHATGITGTKPTLAIATSPRVERHLFLTGDTRIGSVGFEVKHASTPDIRIRDTIFVTFTRPEVEGIDPLSFGNFMMIPELVTEMNVTRNAAHSRELMIQPRNLHEVHLPILIRINVSGFEEVINEAVVQFVA